MNLQTCILHIHYFGSDRTPRIPSLRSLSQFSPVVRYRVIAESPEEKREVIVLVSFKPLPEKDDEPFPPMAYTLAVGVDEAAYRVRKHILEVLCIWKEEISQVQLTVQTLPEAGEFAEDFVSRVGPLSLPN